jgi:Tfp pilus assembly protein PilN
MLETYYRINRAAGVSIQLLQDGNVRIDACSVRVEDNRLDFEKKLTGLVAAGALTGHFPAKTYLALNLYGKGILQKRLEKTVVIDQNSFSQILPNADFADFYVQNFISGEYSFISVIRKTEADKWIAQLQAQGWIPLSLSLGPFPVQNIISQLNVYDSELVFNGHLVRRDEKSDWISYQYQETARSPFPLKIESEPVPEELLMAYAAVFQLILAAQLNLVQAMVPALAAELGKTTDDQKFKARGVVLLMGLFVLLLVNFLAFSWLNASNAKLDDRLSRSAQNTNDLQSINDQVKNKETLLKSLGWDGGVNKSVLTDQLAALLPDEISLREITINPVDPALSRVQKSIQFMDGRIRVTGNAGKILPVNEWIARIKTKKWVKNIQLDSYSYNNELNTGQFTLFIDY